MLRPGLPAWNDPEGGAVPEGLPRVVGAHVHVFPDRLFAAVRRWFDRHAWHIRYALSTAEVFDFLLSRGVHHIIALQYAHAPGMARDLNRYMQRQCSRRPGRITGMATVFPGEDDAAEILGEAFDSGLGGLKLHAHVQCFDLDSEAVGAILEVCRSRRKPVVIHFGNEPKSEAYSCDPHQICRADKLERVLINFSGLRVCVPHLGFGETYEYQALIERYDHLWLDTTMALTDYLPVERRIPLSRYRIDRIMYGSDFPNIPYAWDRELKWLQSAGLPDHQLDRILHRNAADFFGLEMDP